MTMTFMVNGETRHADVAPETPLLWVLRDVLGATGVKFGCGKGQCWGCTVLMDGKARPSCTVKAQTAEGVRITTIEGVPNDHPVKRAWVEEQVPQCGYCQPGQMLHAISLLSENPDPSDEDIARAMQRNLCRCGTYPRIKAAVKRAAEWLRSGVPADATASAGARVAHPPFGEDGEAFSFNPFIKIGADGSVTVIAKHLEAGQGIYTGLATIVAEELDADWSSVRVESAPADERLYNNLFFGPVQATGGSTSTANSYEQHRMAGATARAMLAEAAARAWGAPANEISVEKGVVLHPATGRRASFGELAENASRLAPPPDVRLKNPSAFGLIGKQNERLDIEAKVDATALYAMDMRLPGMLTALVARPPRFGGRVKSFDGAAALTLPGVLNVVEIPQGVAVVATGFWEASQGRNALRIEWDDSGAEMRSSDQLFEDFRAKAETPGLTARNSGDAEAALASAAQTLDATFEFPYLAHAPLEPLNCVARLSDGGCEIWAGDQFQTIDQANAASAAGLDPRLVRINTVFAGGSFGRRANPTSDYIVEAVHIARALGGKAPIHLIWTREDDIRGGRYRPMFVHRIRAGLDGQGNITAWLHRMAGQSIFKGGPFESMIEGGIDPASVEGVADAAYAIPNFTAELHTMDVGVPVLWWRSVGHSHTAFAVEVFLDELAAAAGRDPVELRRALLADQPRHLGVLDLAAGKADWGSPLPPGRGRGVAVHKSFDTFVANVIEVSATDDGGFQVERVVCAVDCGAVVNPEVVRAQMEGGVAFGLSSASGEEVVLDAGVVRQSNFDSYKVLRYNLMPEVEVHIVPSGEAPTGVGEPGVPPVAPAVANAIFAATGKRFRRLPLIDAAK